jgi:hypothetical protein
MCTGLFCLVRDTMKRARVTKRGIGVLVCVAWGGLSLACSGGSDEKGGSGISESTAASYEGIYELTVRTENGTGCDSAGADLLADSEPNFVMLSTTVLGSRLVELVSCAGLDDCRQTAEALQNLQGVAVDYSYTLSEESDPDSLTGFTAWTGFNENGTCVDRRYEDHLLVRMGDTVRLEITTKALADTPAEDDVCWARPAEDSREAKSAPCTGVAAIEGRRLQDL